MLAFLPQRGEFTFPAPYNTTGVRITNETDCGGSDCVNYVGYSYWRRMNNHRNSDEIRIVVGLYQGTGPTLYTYNKSTGGVTNDGAIFPASNYHRGDSAEQYYWSAQDPNMLYLGSDGPQLLRHDISTGQTSVVFDASTHPDAQTLIGRSDIYLFQAHSSNADDVHSATVLTAGGSQLGIVAYRESDDRVFFYPPLQSTQDEAQITRDGEWLWIQEDPDDMRAVNLIDGTEVFLTDEDGSPGHRDVGFGYMVGADNQGFWPIAWQLYDFNATPFDRSTFRVVFQPASCANDCAPNHVSWLNTAPGSPDNQFAVGSTADRINGPFANEIIAFRLDGSLDTLVVAPVMTDMTAGGGGNEYAKLPKGNVDITGDYFIWSSNMMGPRLDVFVVRIPHHLFGQ